MHRIDIIPIGYFQISAQPSLDLDSLELSLKHGLVIVGMMLQLLLNPKMRDMAIQNKVSSIKCLDSLYSTGYIIIHKQAMSTVNRPELYV